MVKNANADADADADANAVDGKMKRSGELGVGKVRKVRKVGRRLKE